MGAVCCCKFINENVLDYEFSYYYINSKRGYLQVGKKLNGIEIVITSISILFDNRNILFYILQDFLGCETQAIENCSSTFFLLKNVL